MRLPIYFLALGFMLLTGCGNDNQSKPTQGTNTTSKTSSADAPGGYIGALGNAQNKAISTIDTTSLDQAVQMFQVQEGRLPKDLNELVDKKFIGKIPPVPYGMRLDYDANTGKVSVVKQ